MLFKDLNNEIFLKIHNYFKRSYKLSSTREIKNEEDDSMFGAQNIDNKFNLYDYFDDDLYL